MSEPPIERLIEASSLGTPDAVALRHTTSDETARRIVERSKRIADDSGTAGMRADLLSFLELNEYLNDWAIPVDPYGDED